MKLQLACVILLFLPLVFSGPVAKFLYENDGQIVIVESKDVLFVSYMFNEERNQITFNVKNNFKSPLEKLTIGVYGLNVSFAVESFVNKKRTSSKSLENLIVSKKGQIILRELTKEEHDEVSDFKGHRNKKVEDFNLTFDRAAIMAETCRLYNFLVAYGQENSTFKLNLDVTTSISGRSRMNLRNEKLSSKSFAIEHELSREKTYECAKDEVDGLKSSACEGALVLKSLKEFYKWRHRKLI